MRDDHSIWRYTDDDSLQYFGLQIFLETEQIFVILIFLLYVSSAVNLASCCKRLWMGKHEYSEKVKSTHNIVFLFCFLHHSISTPVVLQRYPRQLKIENLGFLLHPRSKSCYLALLALSSDKMMLVDNQKYFWQKQTKYVIILVQIITKGKPIMARN